MKEKLYVVFLFSFFALFPSVSRAIVISEIMYDFEGADVDWVEVYNEGEGEVDLSAYKLFISNSTSNHGIKAYSGSAVLGGGEYGVIVANSQVSAYLDRWGSGTNLFTASFSLPNVSEDEMATVELNTGDKEAPVDSVTYEALYGAKGDGNSLQLLDGDWKSSAPTPGEENVFSESSSSDESDDDSEDGDGDDEGENVKKKEPVIKAKIFAKNTVFAGEPADFQGVIMENSEDAAYFGEYYWNFGDGVSILEYGQPDKLRHIYQYPGDYALLLDYHKHTTFADPDYEARMTIKAIPVEIAIKRAEGTEDLGVEITNNSSFELDISSWSLITGSRKYFIFPKRSVILPKKSLTVSGLVTGFGLQDEGNMKLFSSTDRLIAEY